MVSRLPAQERCVAHHEPPPPPPPPPPENPPPENPPPLLLDAAWLAVYAEIDDERLDSKLPMPPGPLNSIAGTGVPCGVTIHDGVGGSVPIAIRYLFAQAAAAPKATA